MKRDFKGEYQKKLVSSDEAVKTVKSGDRIFYSEFTLFPETLDEALSKRITDLENINVEGTCFTKLSKLVAQDPEGKHFTLNDWHFGGVSRKLHKEGLCNYIPLTYHQGPRLIRKYRDYDLAFISVGKMDSKGYFNFGISNSITPAVIEKTKKVILEINENIPQCLGGNRESIHISQVDKIVEGKSNKLPEVPSMSPSEIDVKIAEHIMKEIEDGSCLQLGIGALPNVIGSLIGESKLKDLGVHTEMLVDSFVDLYNKGIVTGANKTIDKYKMVYTFALGTSKLYDFINSHPSCASYPVNYINDPKIIAVNEKVVAVNNAVEIDLFTQVCSETAGTRQISGTGGQLDFIVGAFGSKGGKGIIGLSSTYTDKQGKIHSRIVPTLKPGSIVTLPRSLVQYVATEFGIVQLKGKSTFERAKALIGIAHPDFRDELTKNAMDMNIWS
ncbi:MAG: acetyl-CoA hydrolase/transferase C-terminal domain-containing protein [Desulforegulaceae bacterium]|nr:acetyl-CoA hydrolase/transferase C-terminal domain-containing protein [Desulforegulaceae bacterium]